MKKEVEAISKAWKEGNKTFPVQSEYRELVKKEAADSLKDVEAMERRAAAIRQSVGNELKKNLDDCKMVFLRDHLDRAPSSTTMRSAILTVLKR